MVIIINEHTHLELVTLDHAQPLFELVAANREYLREWLPWIDQMHDVSFIEGFIKSTSHRSLQGKEFAFVIIYHQKIVGRIGVYKIDNQNKIGEIGYWISENMQGQGLITLSCKALIKACFKELALNRIEIKCATGNTKSQQIPLRLGFTPEGTMRKAEYLHHEFIDLYLFSLLKNEALD